MSRRMVLPKLLNSLMVILMGVAIVSLIFLPYIVSSYLNYVYFYTQNAMIKTYFLIVLYLSGLIALLVLYELKKIFKSCTNRTPFIHENVVSLKRIGTASLGIGLIFITKAVMFNTFLTLIVIFVFVLASLFCFVLADVFEEAVSYKLDNDLTI